MTSIHVRNLALLFLLALVVFTSTCVKRERAQASVYLLERVSTNASATQPTRININTASAIELETLPGIGPGFAARIIEHRERFGPFRRPEHLIIVRGISDKRFQALRNFITVE